MFDPGGYTISEYAKEYKKKHPIYAPQGKATVRTVPIFTEEEVRDMPTWEESVLEQYQQGYAAKGKTLIADSTPRIEPEKVAEVSRVMIKVKEPTGDKLYYALDPVSGGKKGTEVNLVDEGLAGEKSFPGAVGLPDIKLPKIGLPSFSLPSFGDFGISALGKAGIGMVLLFIAGIIFLLAVGFSGMGGSAGRVGESEYKRRRK